MRVSKLLVLSALAVGLPLVAQRPTASAASSASGITSATVAGLKFRLIGPGIVSGRIVGLAVVPHHASTYYVAAASGGVWKTTNDGATFTPIFDHEGSYSIGTITLDPNNPETVWVGTGENNSQRTVSYGDGVYRSDDGGASWRNMGLKTSRHIGAIVVDPHDSNVVYVAAEGPLWTSGGERGLYKTTDGGKTWKQVLKINEHTGVSDVVMEPRNPKVLYATAYQRERREYTLIDGGPGSGIYKTTDAGATWTRLRRGLPRVDLGRIGLAISPADPNIIYATVEATQRQGGVFRSTDGGASWQKRNPIQPGAMYYAQIVADPKLPGRVYELNTMISVSDDGGATFHLLGEANKHVDNHVLWIDPNDDSHYIDGCDGGLYESWDAAKTWQWKTTLPLGQYVDVTTDNAEPFYNIYGGTQDNNDEGGPSRTYSSSGITTASWRITHGGDGFHNAVDPTNPDIVYSESQGGGLDRVNLRTHEEVGIQPQPGPKEARFRWGWDVPFFVSPFDHNRLYMAANKVFRSDDRGNTWKEISGDLTQGLDRNAQKVMGRIWGPDAVAKNSSTAPFGKIMDIAESPRQQGLLYAGTDDGLVQVGVTAKNGSVQWTKYDKFPGVPEGTLVSRILPSQFAAHTVFVAFENHKNGDFKPYLLKSTDAGAHWTSIAANLPANGPVLALAQDEVDRNLLFVGTEFGLYFTVDGGGHWTEMRDLPTIAVRSLAIQRREHDLVVGTFGRGIYVLDDYTPLRHLDAQLLASSGAVLPPRPALEYLQSSQYGAPGKAVNGAAFYTGQNLGPVALVTYWIKAVPRTQTQQLQARERKTQRARGDFTPYPSEAELAAMHQQAPPAYSLVISDSHGHPIRVLGIRAHAGLGRVQWDLRGLASPEARRRFGRGGAGAARASSPHPPPGGGTPGALVLPGRYVAALYQHWQGKWTELGKPQSLIVIADPHSTPPLSSLEAHTAFMAKLAKLQAAFSAAQAYSQQIGQRLTSLRATAAAYPMQHQALIDATEALQKAFAPIQAAIGGGRGFGGGGNPDAPPSLASRLSNAAGSERQSLSVPTATSQADYSIASSALPALLEQLKTMGVTDLPGLEQKFTAAGAPVPDALPAWGGAR